MTKKHRKGKYPKRKVFSTSDPATRKKFYKETDAVAPLGPYQIAAGTVQNPRTSLWQVWISTNGLDINHLSAHKEQGSASASVERIKEAGARGDLFDTDRVMALWEEIIAGGDAEPEDLPEEIVSHIARTILHRVIDLKEPEE
jgi:hypothetical protein